MSFVLLGILNAQASGGVTVDYRLQTLGNDLDRDDGTGVALDSSDNIFLSGFAESAGAGGRDFLLAKYNSAGNIQWERVLGGTGREQAADVATDSSGNAYIWGYADSEGEGDRDFLLAKYDTSGTIQWQRILGGLNREEGQSVTVDSSGNVVVVGYSNSSGVSGDYDLFVGKYNSSGTLQWQRFLGGSSYDDGFGVGTDSADNVYVSGQTNSAGDADGDLLVAKYNSSGTIQWQRILSDTAKEGEQTHLAIDSSDNVLLATFTESEGGVDRDALLAKYNSSGTLQWQRILGGASDENIYNVTTDSSDNVYICGGTESTGEGGQDFFIAKYNSSGTLQWQRSLGATSTETAFGIAVDSGDNLYVQGRTNSSSSNYDYFLAVLPNDGSLTGTYSLNSTDYVYAASSLTGATSTLTSSTSSLTSQISSLTGATSTLTSSSATLTKHRVDL